MYFLEAGYGRSSADVQVTTAAGPLPPKKIINEKWLIEGGRNFGRFELGAGYFNGKDSDFLFKGPFISAQYNFIKNKPGNTWIPAIGVRVLKTDGYIFSSGTQLDLKGGEYLREIYLELKYFPRAWGTFNVSVGVEWLSADFEIPQVMPNLPGNAEISRQRFFFGINKYFGHWRDLINLK